MSLEKNLFQWHFIYHKSHMDLTGIEPGPSSWETGFRCTVRRLRGVFPTRYILWFYFSLWGKTK